MDVNVIKIDAEDNMAVATREIKAGEKINMPGGPDIIAASDIPYAHKVALKDIPDGGEIIKYGYKIGFAGQAIKPGDYVHVHNMKTED